MKNAQVLLVRNKSCVGCQYHIKGSKEFGVKWSIRPVEYERLQRSSCQVSEKKNMSEMSV